MPPSQRGILGLTQRPTRAEWRRAFIAFGAGVVLVIALVLLVHPKPPLLPQGAAAPHVVLRDTGGRLHTVVAQGAGHAALIEFLSAACATCRSEAGQLCGAARVPGTTVVGIDASNDSPAAIGAFAQRHLASPCNVPVLLDPGLNVSRSYQVGVVPTVYVVDSHGIIAFAGYGAGGIEQAVQALQQVRGE